MFVSPTLVCPWNVGIPMDSPFSKSPQSKVAETYLQFCPTLCIHPVDVGSPGSNPLKYIKENTSTHWSHFNAFQATCHCQNCILRLVIQSILINKRGPAPFPKDRKFGLWLMILLGHLFPKPMQVAILLKQIDCQTRDGGWNFSMTMTQFHILYIWSTPRPVTVTNSGL